MLNMRVKRERQKYVQYREKKKKELILRKLFTSSVLFDYL